MKRFFLLSIAILPFLILNSCAPEKEELAVADFVQTSGNTKTNMDFKMVSMKRVDEITGGDSIDILIQNNDYRKLLPQEFIAECQKRLKETKLIIMKNEHRFDSIMAKSQKDRYDFQLLKIYFNSIKSNKESYLVDSSLLYVAQKYFNDSAQVLAVKYNMVYSIKNPLLNNAEQQITRMFYLKPDGTKVLAAE